MTTLMIKDLSVTEELNAKAMTKVRGGMYAGYFPYYGGGYYNASSKDYSFDASSIINQGQSVMTNVGNNVAVLGGSASPSVPVTATQNADIHNHVRF